MCLKIFGLLFVLLATISCAQAAEDFPKDMYLRQSVLGEIVQVTPSGEKNSFIYTYSSHQTATVIIKGRIVERDRTKLLGGRATLVMVRDSAGEHASQKIYLCFGREADCAEVLDFAEQKYRR